MSDHSVDGAEASVLGTCRSFCHGAWATPVKSTAPIPSQRLRRARLSARREPPSGACGDHHGTAPTPPIPPDVGRRKPRRACTPSSRSAPVRTIG